MFLWTWRPKDWPFCFNNFKRRWGRAWLEMDPEGHLGAICPQYFRQVSMAGAETLQLPVSQSLTRISHSWEVMSHQIMGEPSQPRRAVHWCWTAVGAPNKRDAWSLSLLFKWPHYERSLLGWKGQMNNWFSRQNMIYSKLETTDSSILHYWSKLNILTIIADAWLIIIICS